MKKFITRSFLFLLPILLSGYLIDIAISNILKKSNSFAQKEYPTWNTLLEGNVNSKIIIHGSSRAWKHFNSTMIEDAFNMNTYNLGIDGHNFWMQYYRHILLLKYNLKPKYILHSLDITTLEKRNDLFNPEQFLPYMLFEKSLYEYTKYYKGYKMLDHFIPLIRYYGKTEAIKTTIQILLNPNSNIIQRVKGYQGINKPWNNDLYNAQKKIGYYDVKIDTASLILFEKYIQECASHNIKIIFVYSPEYIAGKYFVRNREEIMGLYKAISTKNNIPFLNFSNDPMINEQKYFYNSTHMNKEGADKFTKKLIEALIQNAIIFND